MWGQVAGARVANAHLARTRTHARQTLCNCTSSQAPRHGVSEI